MSLLIKCKGERRSENNDVKFKRGRLFVEEERAKDINTTRGDVVVLVGPEVILQIKAGSGTLDMADVMEERNTRDWVIKDVAVCLG